MAGGFAKSCQMPREEEIARFEKTDPKMPAISTLLESEDHIEALLKRLSMGMNPLNVSLKKNFASVRLQP